MREIKITLFNRKKRTISSVVVEWGRWEGETKVGEEGEEGGD